MKIPTDEPIPYTLVDRSRLPLSPLSGAEVCDRLDKADAEVGRAVRHGCADVTERLTEARALGHALKSRYLACAAKEA